jgi:hypothetical protein
VARPLPRGGEGYLILARHLDSGDLRVIKISLGNRRRDERVLELLPGEDVDLAHVVRVYEWDPRTPISLGR